MTSMRRAFLGLLIALTTVASAADNVPLPCNGDPSSYHISFDFFQKILRDTIPYTCENTTLYKYCYSLAHEYMEIDKKPCRDPVVSGYVSMSDLGCSDGSIIDNMSFAHHHRATDYEADGIGASGCAPCGQSGVRSTVDARNDMTRVQSERFHRYRDVLVDSSFGPGVFHNYDEKLYLSTNASGERFVDYFTPRLLNTMRFVDGPYVNPFGYTDVADGVYYNFLNGYGVDLRLYDATGNLTTVQADAARAVLTSKTGDVRTFQIIDLGGGVRAGRVVSIVSRTGATTTITYKFQPGDDLGGSPSRLWQLDRAIDAYGRALVFSYAAQQVSGRWVVSRIDLPSGGANTYAYQDGYLAAVTLADGEVSTITRSYDAASASIVVAYDDAAATGVHRRKKAYLTSTYRLLTDAGYNIFPQSAQLIRGLTNGDGEVAYFNMPHPQYTATMLYEGGGRFSYDAFYLPGKLEHRRQFAKSWTLNTSGTISYGSFAPVYESKYATDSYNTANNYREQCRSTPTTTVDTHGLKVDTAYDSLGQPLTRTYPDGTVERFAYNAFGDTTLVVDRLGRATVSTYDAQGNRLSQTDGLRWNTTTGQADPTPESATRSWIYASFGTPAVSRLVAEIDQNGNRTDYTYNDRGYLASITAPADIAGGPRAVTTISYTDAGLISAVNEPGVNGPRTTSFSYDARNRCTRITYADASFEALVYGSGANANLITERIDRNGNRTVYEFDQSGRAIAERHVAATGNVALRTITRTYDAGTEAVVSETIDGEQRVFTYDYRQRRVAERNTAPGGALQFMINAYDPAHRRYITVDRQGRRAWYRYDIDGHVTRTVRELVVNALPTAPATLDLAGQIPGFLGSLPRVAGANPGYTIEDTQYDAAGQVLATTDAQGVRTTMAYDARGRLTSRTEAAGTSVAATTTYVYDAVGNQVRLTDPLGRITATAWTGRNLRAQVTEASGTAEAASTVFTYTITGKPASTTDARGSTTVYGYGGCCDRLLQITDPAGFVTAFTYDPKGNRLTTLDPNGLLTATAYDAIDRVIASTNAALERTVTTYDVDLTDGVGIDAVPMVQTAIASLGLIGGVVDGSAVSVTNPAGETAYEISDGLGRPLVRIDPLGHATRLVYDAVVDGLVETAQIDALGLTTRVRSDAAGHPRVQIDALGKQSLGGFEADGDQISQVDALGIGWSASYDARHRMLSRTTTRADVVEKTSWTYDLLGNRLTEIDALGKVETSAYDLRNRRVRLTDRMNGATRFAYDAVGNLVAISDADNEARGGLANAAGTTQYAYDTRNLLIAEAFPSGQQGRTLRTYAYDGGRRLTARNVGILAGAFGPAAGFTASAVTTTYAYDAANRLTTRGYADGLNDSFGYDPAARLITAASARYANTVARTYDAAGRLTAESLTLPDGSVTGTTLAPATWTVGYAYLADNSLASQTYPTGSVVTRTYTDRHELATVGLDGTPAASRSYDAGGRLSATAFGNGLIETRTYVPGDQLVATMATANGSTTVSGFSYTYDADRRKLSETDLTGSAAQGFAYDDASRLTSWNRSGGAASTQSWNLTKVGDWTSTTRDGVAEPRTNTAVHEAVQVGPNILAYDQQGNLTRDEHGSALAWDPENRLIRALVTRDASPSGFGSVATYRSDALGRRIAKTVDGQTTLYLPAGAQTVVELTRPALPASQADIDGSTSDGTLANQALAPASGGILSGTPIRINFQPATTATPAGFLRDTGKTVGVRSNGLTYGWSSDATAQAVVRHGAVPLPEFDTFVQAQPDAGGSTSWSIALPDGTYPVIVVAGDALSVNQTNNLVIGGQFVTDATPAIDPPAYEQGNFDGYAVNVVVTGGILTIAPGTGALHAKLCFVEIGAIGTAIDQAAIDRLSALIAKANAQTGANPEPIVTTREYVYGSYVDEVVAYTQTVAGVTSRYYPHYNHLYSVDALTDGAGAVVEKYRYTAYGKQTITAGVGGAIRAKSAVGFDRGFTGYITDSESGYLFARSRMYSPGLGRFVGRDRHCFNRYSPSAGDGYADGLSLYNAYFVPNALDPAGNITVQVTKKEKKDCGGRNVEMTFRLDNKAPCDGYIVQKVTMKVKVYDCKNNEIESVDKTFWESWPVKKGSDTWKGQGAFGFPNITDSSQRPSKPNSYGTAEANGEIKFFCGTTSGNLGDPTPNPPVPPDPGTGFGGGNQVGTSGDLFSTGNQPAWWANASDGGEKAAARSVKSDWICCPCPFAVKNELTVTP